MSLAVPPRVAEFQFPNKASAGIRVKVICTLEVGDLPVALRWLKDGQDLASQHLHAPSGGISGLGSSVEVRQNDPYSIDLTIPRLGAEHSGEYACEASNAAGSASYAAPLEVSGRTTR